MFWALNPGQDDPAGQAGGTPAAGRDRDNGRIVRGLLVLGLIAPLAAAASDHVVVSDRVAFIGLVDGEGLRPGVPGIDIQVRSEGRITGRASGRDIAGTRAWQDGRFCRETGCGGMLIPDNCRLVEIRGDDIRFTVDGGAGDPATFNLR